MDETSLSAVDTSHPLPFRVVAGEPPSAEHRLTLPQIRALSYRASTGAEMYTEVASVAGVAESTIRYWLRTNLRFAELWEGATESLEVIASALRRQGRVKSLQTLLDVQDRADVPASVIVDAAAKFLTNDAREKQDRREEVSLAMMMAKWTREADRAAVDGEVTGHA